MAYVSIKEAVVKSSFYDGKGAKIAEQFTKRDGSAGESYYTLFFNEPHGLADDTKLTKVGGVLSTKGRIYDPEDGEARAVVDVVLNNPTFEVAGAPAAQTGDTPPW